MQSHLNKVNVRARVLEFPQIAVDLIKPADLPAVVDIQAQSSFLDDVLSTLAIHDTLKILPINIAVTEFLLAQKSAAGIDICASIDIGPKWQAQTTPVILNNT